MTICSGEPQFHPLDLSELNADPFKQFRRWFADAQERSGLLYPNAFTLSTVDADGAPDSRIVLMKDLDPSGFTFYTNFTSHKGQELAFIPKAAMCFYWDRLNRQVRVRGRVENVTAAEADEYFATRPRESQLAAWASLQSQPMSQRSELEVRLSELARVFEGKTIHRPAHWSGKRIVPMSFEFWQERANRLHDRFIYRLTNENHWNIVRLYP